MAECLAGTWAATPRACALRVPRAAQSSKVSALVGTLSAPNRDRAEPRSRKRLLRLLATKGDIVICIKLGKREWPVINIYCIRTGIAS